MVPFVILLFVVGAFSSNEVESQCGDQDYQRCISLAEPLLKDPNLIYPLHRIHIGSFCRKWFVFVGCMKNYTELCFTEAKRQEFNKTIESLDSSIRKVCWTWEFRRGYLTFADCMKYMLTLDLMCGRHYKLLVSQVTGEAPPSRPVCCSRYLLRECVYDHAKHLCDPVLEPTASSLFDKALSFLREQCANYVPSQADCPWADFYMSKSPSMATSNTHYSADPTPTFSSSEVNSNCSKQDYQRCVSLAEPLLKDPHLIYPNNTQDIESVCRKWSGFVDCIEDYTERCFTESRRQEFNQGIESLNTSIHKVCSSPEYKNDYLKHATCMKMILTQDTMCGLHFKLLVRKVPEEAPLSALPSRPVCRSHNLLRECVVHHAKLSCDPESAPSAISMLDKAMSSLREQCAKAATNANYSSTMSTSSLPTSTTPSRPDLWIPDMRPPPVVDDSIDEPQDPHGLSGSQRLDNSVNQLTSLVLLLRTALMLLARGPALTR